MTEYLKALLSERKIDLVSPVSLSESLITRGYKLDRCGFGKESPLTALMIAVPYLTPAENRNISAYAVPRDYHLFYKELFDDILPRLREKYPEYRFFGFADDSPIDERQAAAMAGLGILGDNGMLITEKYSSYIFLGEIITDYPVSCQSYPIKRCEGCGKCKRACPMSELGQCLSALTQKKGELDEYEKRAILKYGSAWGCDKCQEVCPHTQRAIERGTIYTAVDFFRQELVPTISTDILDGMSDTKFKERAYSWRGRHTIRRNAELFENQGEL